MPMDIRDDNMCKRAIKKNSKVIKYVPDKIKEHIKMC